MDSYDNDLMLLMLMDDDLFFVDISVEEREPEDVDRIQSEPFSKARR
jgi:hypothetical protein